MTSRSIVLGLACLVPLAGPVWSQADRALSVEQVAMDAVRPDEARLEIAAELTDADGIYHVGDQVGLTVELSRPAHLLVLNIDAAGSVTSLFPNEFHTESFVPGGETLVMPGEGARIFVAGPAGVEIIKVIASDKPIDLSAVADFLPAGPFLTSAPGTAGRLARALAVEPVAPPAAAPETPVAEAPPAETAPVEPTPVAGTPAAEAPVIWGTLSLQIVTEDAPVPVPVPGGGGAEGADSAAPFGLAVESDRPRYSIGEAIRFTVNAERPCTLAIVASGPDGETDMLLPNPAYPDTQLAPATPRTFEGFHAIGPAGLHRVRAFCATTADGTAPAPVVVAGAEPVQPATGARAIAVDLPAGDAWVAEAAIEIEIAE